MSEQPREEEELPPTLEKLNDEGAGAGATPEPNTFEPEEAEDA